MADKNSLTTILSACFYDGTLPLGFASSPAISDFFLHEVDRRMSMVSGIVYTRYADDFLISSMNIGAQFVLENAYKVLRGEVERLGLELNDEKTFYRPLKNVGDSIHFLGLNLVRTGYPFNRITVSNSYIRETSKQLAGAIMNADQKAYEAVRGRIAFIAMCSDESMEKFKKLVSLKLKLDVDEMLESKTVKEARFAMNINQKI